MNAPISTRSAQLMIRVAAQEDVVLDYDLTCVEALDADPTTTDDSLTQPDVFWPYGADAPRPGDHAQISTNDRGPRKRFANPTHLFEYDRPKEPQSQARPQPAKQSPWLGRRMAIDRRLGKVMVAIAGHPLGSHALPPLIIRPKQGMHTSPYRRMYSHSKNSPKRSA